MSFQKSAVRFSCILLFSIALAIAVRDRTSEWAVAHAMEVGAQEQVLTGDAITGNRPVEEMATLMEQRYASPVTYEDPMWEFQGDLATGAKFPKDLTFVVPAELTPAHRPKLDAEVLNEAIAAYHSQTGGPRYRIATSRLGLHLIPDQVRGVDGAFATARNPLDTVVNMPVTLRSVSQHVQDLCTALSAATGDRIIYLPGQSDRAGYKDLTVAWGARDVSGREALIDLLEPSAATLHWHLNCLSDRLCFFQVEPINLPRPVLVIGPSAMPHTQTPILPFDWCPGCKRPALDLLPLLAPPPVVVK
jgi:hypothetical protein